MCRVRFGSREELDKEKFPSWWELFEFYKEQRVVLNVDPLSEQVAQFYMERVLRPHFIMPVWTKEQVKVHITEHIVDERVQLAAMLFQAQDHARILRSVMQRKTTRELRRMLDDIELNAREIRRELERRL